MWELEEQVEELLEKYMKSAEAVRVSASKVGLDIRAGSVYVSVEENWIAVRGGTRTIDYYGGFEYIDPDERKTIGDYTFYEGDNDRVQDCLEYYSENLTQNKEGEVA